MPDIIKKNKTDDKRLFTCCTKKNTHCSVYVSKEIQPNHNTCNIINENLIDIKTEITANDVKLMFDVLKNTEDVEKIVKIFYKKNKLKHEFLEVTRARILDYINLMKDSYSFRDKMLNKVRNFKKIKFTDKLVNQLSYSRGNDIYNYQRSAFFVFDNKFYKKISESFKKFDTSLKNTSTGCNERWFNGIKYDLNKQITKLLDKNNGNFTVCK